MASRGHCAALRGAVRNRPVRGRSGARTPAPRRLRALKCVPLGQAAVESAIILPLYVFVILGVLQLGLMTQAQLMTKYAAYRAARTGAVLSAKHSSMQRAAMQVLLPFTVVGTAQGEKHLPSGNATAYAASWNILRANREGVRVGQGAPGFHYRDVFRGAGREQRILDVLICNPTNTYGAIDLAFDSPQTQQIGGTSPIGGAGQAWGLSHDWGRMGRKWLVTQVVFYYRMPIPFANSILWHLARGDELTALPVTMEVTRMATKQQLANPPPVPPAGQAPPDGAGDRRPMKIGHFSNLANNQKVYVMPLRASYGMRMHSDFLGVGGANTAPDDFRLPDSPNNLAAGVICEP